MTYLGDGVHTRLSWWTTYIFASYVLKNENVMPSELLPVFMITRSIFNKEFVNGQKMER